MINIISNYLILKFSESFNQLIDNLPISVKEIYLKSKFSHKIDNLPNSIEKIYFIKTKDK